MKYTITINQSAVFSNGMINKTDLVDWAIIDYLKDFAIYRKSKRIYVKDSPRPSRSATQPSNSTRSKNCETLSQNQITQERRGNEYIWLNYNHLINSLPLANLKYKAKLAHRINKLRDLGLIKTVKNVDNTLYYTFTDKLIDICFAKPSDIERLRKNVGQGFSLANKESKPKGLPYKTENPVQNATPPITNSVTPPVTKSVTAQYKTKNTIYNKYKYKKNFVNLLSLKPKTDKQEINPAPIYTSPEIINTSDNLNITRYRNRCGVNADNNRNNSFFSSSLKPKKIPPQISTDEHRLELHTKHVGQGFSLAKQERNPKGSPYNTNSACSAVKNIKGFTTMSGSVWKILADIKERQTAQN
jgi:hypothetical protein